MRALASILIILILVLITPVFLLVTSVKANVLTATFLKAELSKYDLYGLAFRQIDEQIKQIEIPPEFPVTHEEISTLVNQVVTPEWLQRNVEGAFDSFESWLNAPAGRELSVVISLAEPKSALVRELDTFLTNKLAVLTPCDPNRPQEEQGICQFAGRNLDEVKEMLKQNGMDPDMITNLLPDTLDLVNPDLSKITGTSDAENPKGSAAKSAEIKNRLELVKSYYQLGVRFFWYAWILYGVLIAEFIVMNTTKCWRRLVRWTGALLFSIGILPLAMAIASVQVVQNILLPKIQIDPKFPAEIAPLIPSMIADFRATIFTLPLVVGLVFVGLGLAGMVGGHWIAKKK